MQIRELSCKTLQIPIKTIKPQKTGKKSKKKTGKNPPKNCSPIAFQGELLEAACIFFLLQSWQGANRVPVVSDCEARVID
jgi:hypothetical protein